MTDPAARVCLLNPGPVTLTETVRKAMLGPDICHREPVFSDLMNRIRNQLREVYAEESTAYSAVLTTGSGTSAVEAMLGTLVPHDQRALVCCNGVYGERMANMLLLQQKEPLVLKGEWTAPLDIDAIEKMLKQNPEISHVVVVHHETTTGRLNDLDAVGALCHRYETPMLVDAVSSFGGADLPLKRWNVQACAGTANKCLHSVPGISFTLVETARLETQQSHSHSLYLDLITNHNAQCSGFPAFTPAIQTLYALEQALVELAEEGGWFARSESYRQRTELLLKQIPERVKTLLDEGHSQILTAFNLPDDIPFDDLYDHLRADGFVIYAGQKQLMDKIFRLSVMGDLRNDDFQRLHQSLSRSALSSPTRTGH